MTSLARAVADWAALGFLRPSWRPAGFVLLGRGGRHGAVRVPHFPGRFVSERCPGNLHELPRDDHRSTSPGSTAATPAWPPATIATCRTPRWPAQYAFKAKDGLWHATVFTMRWEPQVIRLSARAVPVVEDNCRRCHAAGDRRRGPGRASAGRPAVLGLPSRGAARLGAEPVGHARRVPAAIAAGAAEPSQQPTHRRTTDRPCREASNR